MEILEFHRIRMPCLPMRGHGALVRIVRWTHGAGALALLVACGLGVDDAAAATTSVYVANSGDQTISQFSRQSNGQLTALTPPSVALAGGPVALASTSDGHHLYVATGSESGSGALEELAIAADGSLQPLTPSALALGGFPTSVATSPDARHVYVTEFVEGTGTVAQFAVGAGGALSPLSPASVPVEAATEIAITPDGRHAYVVDGETSGYVWQFEVAGDGTLHALTPASIQVGFKPHGLVISPDGHNVYVVDGHKALDQLAVTEDGTLQALTPPSVTTIDYPVSIGPSPDGGGLIATEVPGEEATGVVQSFKRSPEGALSAEASKPVPPGDLPWGLAISPDGQSAYVTSRLSSGNEGLWQLGVAPSNQLESLTPPFLETGAEPASIAIATQQSPASSGGSSSGTSPATGSSPAAAPAAGGAPPPPTANAVVSRGRRKRRGESFTFDATLSVDPGGRIVAYRWTLNGHVISTAPRFHRFFSNAHRSYALTLTVLNSAGVSASTLLTVSPRSRRAPVVNVTVPARASFCIDCAQPSPATARILRRLRRYARGARLVSISSYADATGTRAYNLNLTRRRSQSIARLLLAGLSPAPRDVQLSWHGESDPVASNATSAGRARNRRSVIRIVR
ncbi:MAG: beta-propeller fold lactonase family protein [Solirubrobacteraceae bacterium]